MSSINLLVFSQQKGDLPERRAKRIEAQGFIVPAATTMLVRRDFDHGQLCAKQLLSTPSLPVQEYFYQPDYHPSSCMLGRVV